MVRLSLVNLYLHGFTDPHIFEYDTLTSEERWNEFADVILANPPFMSPKGGIKPHKRFSIQAKRSEVLFVDYMAEHLTPNGRAGIIVPEGIIFQSQTAYTALRKMLVDTCLVAVVSLPAGCFNPYSGVKTSILVLDKSLARAGRPRPSPSSRWRTTASALGPSAVTYSSGANVKHLQSEGFFAFEIPLPPMVVQKEIVAEIEGYQKVINGARAVLDHYRPHIPIHPDWPTVELGHVCEAILTGPFGTALHQSDYVDIGIPVINPQNIVDGAISTDGVKMVTAETRDRLQEFTVRANDILIGRRGEMGRCAVADPKMNGWLCGTGCFVIRLKSQCDVRFAFFQISSPKVKAFLEEQAVGVTMKNLNQGILSAIQIPLPPLATQQAIVAEIEAEQALVAANRELITRFEAKIQATLARVWGEAAPVVQVD
jgi:type I restriction enzyme M protein